MGENHDVPNVVSGGKLKESCDCDQRNNNSTSLFPVFIQYCNIKIYLGYLKDKDGNSIAKQSQQITIKLYNSGQNSFNNI